MSKENSLETIKKNFEEIIKVVDEKFGKDYSSKNPGLVQHLLTNVQQEEDRKVTEKIHVR